MLGTVLGPGSQWCTLHIMCWLVGQMFSREKQIKGILKLQVKMRL